MGLAIFGIGVIVGALIMTAWFWYFNDYSRASDMTTHSSFADAAASAVKTDTDPDLKSTIPKKEITAESDNGLGENSDNNRDNTTTKNENVAVASSPAPKPAAEIDTATSTVDIDLADLTDEIIAADNDTSSDTDEAATVDKKTAAQEVSEPQTTVDIEELKDALPKATSDPDDLQDIKGVGPVLEKTLNTLGIVTFRQVALLTDKQAEEVAIAIKTFPDRMHRDNWLPQAAELHLNKYKEKVK